MDKWVCQERWVGLDFQVLLVLLDYPGSMLNPVPLAFPESLALLALLDIANALVDARTLALL